MADIDGYSKENWHTYIAEHNYELPDESQKIALGKKCTWLIVRFFQFFSPNKNEFYIHRADKEIAGCRDGYLKDLAQKEQWIQPLLSKFSQLGESTRRQIVPEITKLSSKPLEREKLVRAEIVYKEIVGEDCAKIDLEGVTDALKAQVAAEFGLPTKIAGQMVDEILGKTDGYQTDLQALRNLKASTSPEQFYALVHAAGSNELSLVQPKTINILTGLASLTAEKQKEQLIARTLAPDLENISQKLQQQTENLRKTEELVKATTAELNGIEASLSDISERERATLEEASKVSEAVSPRIALMQSELQKLQAKGFEIENKTQGSYSQGLEIHNLRKEIRSLENEKKALGEKIGVVGQYISLWDNEDVTLAKKQLAEVDNTLIAKQGDLKNLIESERKRLAAHKTANEELGVLSAHIMSKQSELNQLTSPGEEHKRQLAVLSTERAPFVAKKSELEAHNKELASQIAQQDSIIKGLQSQKATLENTVSSNVNRKDLRTILQELVALELRPSVPAAPAETTINSMPDAVVAEPVVTEDFVTEVPMSKQQSLVDPEGDKLPAELPVTSMPKAVASEPVITEDSVTEEFIQEPQPLVEPEVAKPTEIDALIQGIKTNPMSLMKFLFPILSPLIPTPDVQKQAKALLEDKAILQTISGRVQNTRGPRNAGVLNTIFGIVSSRLNNPAANKSPAAAVQQGMKEATAELKQIAFALKNQSADIARSIEDGEVLQLKGNFSPEVTDYVLPALFKFLTVVRDENQVQNKDSRFRKTLSSICSYGPGLDWRLGRAIAGKIIFSQIEKHLPVQLTNELSKAVKACLDDTLAMLSSSGISAKLLAVLNIVQTYVNDPNASFDKMLKDVSPAIGELVALIDTQVVSKWNFDGAFTT